MFSDLIKELDGFSKVLDYLSQITITFGNLKGKGSVTVNILNTDDTITKTTMDVNDAIYLTENGTLTIPAKPFMKEIKEFIEKGLDEINTELIDMYFQKGYTTSDVKRKCLELEHKVNANIPIIIRKFQDNISTLSSLTNQKETTLINMNEISKFISCKIFLK